MTRIPTGGGQAPRQPNPAAPAQPAATTGPQAAAANPQPAPAAAGGGGAGGTTPPAGGNRQNNPPPANQLPPVVSPPGWKIFSRIFVILLMALAAIFVIWLIIIIFAWFRGDKPAAANVQAQITVEKPQHAYQVYLEKTQTANRVIIRSNNDPEKILQRVLDDRQALKPYAVAPNGRLVAVEQKTAALTATVQTHDQKLKTLGQVSAYQQQQIDGKMSKGDGSLYYQLTRAKRGMPAAPPSALRYGAPSCAP